jgi:hypothetical protein
MDISTLQMLVLMACGVAIIVGLTFATTSDSSLLKAGGYAFTATLIAVIAAAVFHASAKDLEALHARNIAGLWLLAGAGWAGVNAIRAYK